MVDVADEFADFAANRGFQFTPTSRAALARDFPRLQELEQLSQSERAALYDIVLAEVPSIPGITPTILHENSIFDAARRVSQSFATRGVPFSPNAENVIRDCCPFC